MVCFGVVKGRVWLVHILGQCWVMLVCLHSFETVSDKSATSWVISPLTIGPVGDGSVRVIDGKSLANMMVE